MAFTGVAIKKVHRWASLKIKVAYGGEASRNSTAHWRPAGKQPVDAG